MVPVFALEEIVRDARSRTGIPGVAAAVHVDGHVVSCADGVLELGKDEPVRVDTPFRIASISKPFTASLALSCLPADAELRAWLSHTAGLRTERREPLPEEAQGLFSYSNAGYWAAGAASAAACDTTFDAAMRERIIEPLGLKATGIDPGGERFQRGRIEVTRTLLRVARPRDEPGRFEHLDVLGHALLRHRKRLRELVHGCRTAREASNECAPDGVRQREKCPIEALLLVGTDNHNQPIALSTY